MHDLGIEGGTLVTPQRQRRGNLYVDGGRVTELTEDVRSASARVDATGLLVMPGMVDAHVHFMDPGAPEREDFPTGSSAAAAAGVTTVIEHTHAQPVIDASDLLAKVHYLRGRSYVDFALAAHAWPDRIADARSAWEAGAAYVKAFTCTTHGVPGFDAAALRTLFALAAEIGGVCLVHCEDETITAAAERELRELGRIDNRVIPEWRHRDAELTSISVATLLAMLSGARVVIAHVSNADGLAIIDYWRGAGASVVAESCPQYFFLHEHEVVEHGAFRKFTPPARAKSDRDLDAMWAALRDGTVAYISTDHAPSTAEQKRQGSIWDVHFGLPGIDTTLPLLLDAAARGLISYERLVEAYSEAPARMYGLGPRKGTLALGADADVVLVDPVANWEITDQAILSRAAWSPFAGRTVRGAIVQTYSRGKLVADARTIVGEPSGQFIAGSGARGEAATGVTA